MYMHLDEFSVKLERDIKLHPLNYRQETIGCTLYQLYIAMVHTQTLYLLMAEMDADRP